MIKQTTEESPETAECPACADTFLAGTANEDGWCEECDSARHHRALPAKVTAFSEAAAPAGRAADSVFSERKFLQRPKHFFYKWDKI